MNITNMTIGNFTDFVSLVNQEVYGSFGLGIILLFCLIGFAYLNRKYNTQVSVFLSLALCLPMVSVFTLLSLLDSAVFYLYVLVLGLSGIYAYVKKGREW